MSKKALPKWELARYLIDAKKNIDTVIFIEKYSENLYEFPHDNLKKAINEFCNSTCNVLDNIGLNKKDLCTSEVLIDTVYTERDKNVSHKDKDYSKISFDLRLMKNILRKVKRIAKDNLPQRLTLNFLCWDPILFRMMRGISKENELSILQKQKEQFNKFGPNLNINSKFDNEDIIKEQQIEIPKISKQTKNITFYCELFLSIYLRQ